jgi:antitoxin Phd
MEAIMGTYSIAEAKNALPSLVHAAETGQCVQITRRGKPVAVLLSMDDYERLTTPRPSFSAALAQFFSLPPQDFSQDPSHDLSLDLSDLRDTSPGRSFDW